MPDPHCPHCQTPISEHPAGRCLDAWVAKAVMGWGIHVPLKTDWSQWGWALANRAHTLMVLLSHSANVRGVGSIWHPSEDIAAAWEVWEYGEWSLPYYITKSVHPDNEDGPMGYIVAPFYLDDEPHMVPAWAPAAPLAICRAGILAITSEGAN